MTGQEGNQRFVQQWIQELLRNAEGPDMPVKEAIGRCSQICYDRNDMGDLIYAGRWLKIDIQVYLHE